MSPAIRVGIIIFLAVLLFTLVYFYLSGYNVLRNTYVVTAIFTDAQGLERGSKVNMAGVTIGQVSNIELDAEQRAVVVMRINRRYRIPRGSRFVLRVGLLVGERSIDIMPNREEEEYLSPGAVVRGETPVRLEDLLPQTERLIANLTEASEGLRNILADENLELTIERSLANIESATLRLDRSMAAIENLTATQQGEIRTIVANVVAASENVRELTEELERLARQPGLQEDIAEAVASARRTVQSLERTTAALEELLADPEFQEDIRETVTVARRTVERAGEVLERVGRILPGDGIRPRIPTRETSFDLLYMPDDGRFRGTLSTTLSFSEQSFLTLGLFDLGASNRLIAQPGRSLGRNTDLRYGIYASRLGLGLDHAFSPRLFGSLNVYDPEDPRTDLQFGYRVGNDLGLLLGVDRLFDDNQLTMGVRLTR